MILLVMTLMVMVMMVAATTEYVLSLVGGTLHTYSSSRDPLLFHPQFYCYCMNSDYQLQLKLEHFLVTKTI